MCGCDFMGLIQVKINKTKYPVKKAAGLLLAGMLLAVSSTGCGSGGHSDDNKGNTGGNNNVVQSDNPAGEGADERKTLTIGSFNRLVTEDFINAFQEAYPEVDLDIVGYYGANGSGYAQYSLENGDIPDIYITTQSFSEQAQQEYLLNLSNYDFVNNYSSGLLDSLDIDGDIYLLPSGYQLTGIYYNKTILSENGWDAPENFEELVALSGEIEAAGYRTMGHEMDLDGYPFNYFFNIGNTVYFGTPDGTEWKGDFPQGTAKADGNSGLQAAVDYFDRWVENGFITAEHTTEEQFFNGECVFFLSLRISGYENTTETGKTYEFGIIPWLSEDGSNNMLTRTVSKYVGINKSLAEAGNEQKLEEALKLLHYISTQEGQRALMAGGTEYMPPLNDSTIEEASPYQEIADLVKEGRTVPLLYVGWEDLIVPIAQDIRLLITGGIDAAGLPKAFDSTNNELMEGSSDDIYAVAEETLTLEKTAELAAIAEGKAVGADCALISLNAYHGDDMYNNRGLAWYIYEGNVTTAVVNMIRPLAATVSLLELTGAEIKAMRDAGFDLDGDGNPYDYLLFTKGNMELDDAATYKLAISTGELTEDMLARAVKTEISPAGAIKEYLTQLGTVSADAVYWE